MNVTILKRIAALMLAVSLVVLSSCGDDNPTSPVGVSRTLAEGDVLSGTYGSGDSVTVPADTTIEILGTVRFNSGSSFVINEGAIIKARNTTSSFIVMNEGSTIDWQGTASSPIVFTSTIDDQLNDPPANDDDSASSGDWGGIIIVDDAANEDGVSTVEGYEFVSYGGTGASDQSSGIISYVKVFYAGATISSTVDLNGVSFFGVGSGTTVEYLQVHNGLDDGVEFYGGAVNVDNLICTAVGDDAIDWVDGWSGTINNGIAYMLGGKSSDPYAMEGEGPATPTFINMTVAGEEEATSTIALIRARDGETQTWSNAYWAFDGDVEPIFNVRGTDAQIVNLNNVYVEGTTDTAVAENKLYTFTKSASSATVTVNGTPAVSGSITLTEYADRAALAAATASTAFDLPSAATSAGVGADYSEFSAWVDFRHDDTSDD